VHRKTGCVYENEVRWPQVAIFLAYLTGAHLAEAALSEHPVHAKRFVGDGLRLKPLPLQVSGWAKISTESYLQFFSEFTSVLSQKVVIISLDPFRLINIF